MKVQGLSGQQNEFKTRMNKLVRLLSQSKT